MKRQSLDCLFINCQKMLKKLLTYYAFLFYNYTNNIQNISNMVVLSVENLTKNSEELMNVMNKTVATDYEKFKESGESYFKDAQSVEDIMNAYDNNTNSLSETIKSMTDDISNIANNMGECSDGVAQVTNDTCELVGVMSDIKAHSDDNTSNIEELKKKLVSFNISGHAAAF